MIDYAKMMQHVTAHPYKLLFATISGAHLYGFPSPDSDFDLRGVHVLPLRSVVGLQVNDETIEKVGIYDGLEILQEDTNLDAQSYALDVIRNVTEQASAPLQFARFAFGAAGSAAAMIDLATAEKLSRGFVGDSKHKIKWHSAPGHMAKDRVKLLLNLVSSAISALPRGGEIAVEVLGELEHPTFRLTCTGNACRSPQYLGDFISGAAQPQLDAMTIQAYYTWRLAECSGMRLGIAKVNDAILIEAIATA